MTKKMLVFGSLLCVIGIVGLTGCGQQAATSTAKDYTKAATDLKNVASGLQSAGGNTANSSGGGVTTKSIGSGLSSLSAIPTGWSPESTVTFESAYTWTTSTGTLVTEEAKIYARYLDAGGNQLGWSLAELAKAKKQQNIINILSSYYSGYLNQMIDLSPTAANTLILTAEGRVTFTETPVSTFEILDMSLAIGGGSLTAMTGNFDWGYRAPGETYAYYYGTANISISNLGANPSAITGDVYQDITDDGTKNGSKVGVISFADSGVKITLDNGTVIYAGTF